MHKRDLSVSFVNGISTLVEALDFVSIAFASHKSVKNEKSFPQVTNAINRHDVKLSGAKMECASGVREGTIFAQSHLCIYTTVETF